MDHKVNHLQMIQGIISRMGQNSFLLKGWAITLVAALFALSGQGAREEFLLFAYVPILIFWVLDAYYLRQERMYIHLYDYVRKKDDKDIDYNMNLDQLPVESSKLFVVFLSKTILVFYLPITILIVLAMLFLP
ncbi:hypothetical protein MUN89_16885 [Halobacillus salinarum]|uniref:Uncharacterized protein n=1 Tax=Halobacillus salinarum TaxID=2932257 RepID=A0ABY4EHM0_9BACI|nr:hypothetical protein [Halobacillus salinarum]UOQ43572.1 hypothetical protein MUN89_16885 [Halobacillus salinarum]